jgi:hypothetical protein
MLFRWRVVLSTAGVNENWLVGLMVHPKMLEDAVVRSSLKSGAFRRGAHLDTAPKSALIHKLL